MQNHERWLAIAADDLDVAKIVIPQKLFAPATYHCQQAAEKSLKGYLVFKKQPIIKTHDLAKLLQMCIEFDKDFETIYEAIRYLNPLATKFRYPTEFDMPDKTDAEIAIEYAENVMHFVQRKILELTSGQENIFGIKNA